MLILQEGKVLLGDEQLEKTRAQTEAAKEAAEESTPEKPSIPRDNTMVVTAQVIPCTWNFSFLSLSCMWHKQESFPTK